MVKRSRLDRHSRLRGVSFTTDRSPPSCAANRLTFTVLPTSSQIPSPSWGYIFFSTVPWYVPRRNICVAAVWPATVCIPNRLGRFTGARDRSAAFPFVRLCVKPRVNDVSAGSSLIRFLAVPFSTPPSSSSQRRPR